MLAVNIGTHFFWITSRAAGIVALLLASASVAAGIAISGRFGRMRGPDLRVTHEALSLGALAALVLHAVALLGDSFFHPTIADLVIPFAMNYKEPYMAIGILGGWGMLLLGLSYYARERIGISRWKALHRLTAVAWILGVVHTLGEGTDAGQLWFLAMTLIVIVPTGMLLVARILTTPAARAPSGSTRT